MVGEGDAVLTIDPRAEEWGTARRQLYCDGQCMKCESEIIFRIALWITAGMNVSDVPIVS
jgi:hypothetical protein